MNGLGAELEALGSKGLRRSLTEIQARRGPFLTVGRKSVLNFASNDYLGLASHPSLKAAAARAVRRWGTGSGASRLLSGSLGVHTDLERKIAAFKKEEAALIFSSGYLANLGAVTALVGEQDVVLCDRLNHASLVDAARLSKAKLWVYPHRDTAELARLLGRASSFRRRLVVTDAYFSMDGTVAPLDRILTQCREHGAWLLVDEAHSTGVYGESGAGLTEHFGLSGKVDVVMGTFSKALGSVGGFIAGSRTLRDYLVNRSREFIYTTAPAPAASAAASAAIDVVRRAPVLRKKLWSNTEYLRRALAAEGFDLMGSEGPVIPVRMGSTALSVAFRDFLVKNAIFAPAIRPPTVPKGTDRIRLSVSAAHETKHLDALVAAFRKARKKIL